MLWGIQAFITIIEIIGSFIWIRVCIPEKNNSLLQKKIASVAGIVLVTILTVYQRSIAMYSRHYLLFCILLCSIICLLRFGYKSRYFIMMALYYETIYCLDLILCIVAGYFANNADFIWKQQYVLQSERIIIYLVARCMALAILFVIYWAREKYFLWDKWIYLIPVFEYLTLLGIDTVLAPAKQELAWHRVKIVFVMNLLFILFLTIFYIYNMKESISELVGIQRNLYTQSYENITLRRLEKERIFHDMKNHLLAIRGMIQSEQMEQLQSYVDQLFSSIEDAQEYTGKRLVDYLISEKTTFAEKRGISVYLNCGSLEENGSSQEDIDWTAVLGNLWDNAIESCERCDGEKLIRFYIEQRGGIVCIRMENSCPVSTKRTGLATLKNPNEMHGIGMRSIRYVISKYHGTLDWKCQNDKFMINIIMYM